MRITPIKIRNFLSHTPLAPAPCPLANMLNLWAVEDGALIGVDMQFSHCYEIILPDLTYMGESEQDGFYNSVKNIFHSLPDGTVLQFLVRIKTGADKTINQYKEINKPKDDISRLVMDWGLKHLNNTFIQSRKYYLFLTVFPDPGMIPAVDATPLSLFVKNKSGVTAQLHKNMLNRLNETSSILTNGLSGAGIKARRFEDKETVSFLYEYLNPSRRDFLDTKDINPEKTLRSQIVFNACENNFDSVYLDGYYYRAVNLAIRPENAHFDECLKMLSAISPNADVCFNIFCGEQSKYFKYLNSIAAAAKNVMHFSILGRNHEAEMQLNAVEDLTEEAKAAFQKLYAFSTCIILRERTLEKLTTRTNEALQAFRELGAAEGMIDDMNHLPLFLSALPGHGHLNFRKHVFHTDAVGQMLPLSAPWVGCKDPKMIFKTDDDQILPIDLFESDITSSAKCGLIIGTQGSGKSFTTNYFLTKFYAESEKNHIVIIDVGASYRKLCSLFGGEYLEVELSDKYAFNPFPSKSIALKDESEDNYKVEPDTLEFLTLMVQKMLKIRELTGIEQKILENAITSVYRESKNDAPLLGELEERLMDYKSGDEEDRKTARNFGKNLAIWTSGRYGELVNRPSTLHPESRLIVFDLQKLKEQPELQTMIFFLIQTVIERKLKDKTLKKMIVIDEGWQFFSDEVGSKLIINMYKTIRKFNGLVWSISQSPKDFVESVAADAITTNSIVKIILKIESGHELLEKLKFPPAAVEVVKNLKAKSTYREVLMKFSDYFRVLKIEPSKADYWICTTNAKDGNTEAAYRAKHPRFTEAEIIEGLAKNS